MGAHCEKAKIHMSKGFISLMIKYSKHLFQNLQTYLNLKKITQANQLLFSKFYFIKQEIV